VLREAHGGARTAPNLLVGTPFSADDRVDTGTMLRTSATNRDSSVLA
jgi:hypothetical protein